jgi:SAM-dependent methyltransferase
MKQFDKHADAYNVVRGKVAYPEKLYQILVQFCQGTEAALDIGCGNGVSTIRLAPYFKYVEGSDLGANLIEKARDNYPGITFNVSPAETYESDRKFDLITSATSFYWMDRDVVLQRVKSMLKPGGVFCAYKYDFPVTYGPLRDFIESELVNKWSRYRDQRLTKYDDSLERIKCAGGFKSAERNVISNIIDLSPLEVGLFFLSTSYVTKYMDQEGGASYAENFLDKIQELEASEVVKVNFDIHSFIAVSE